MRITPQSQESIVCHSLRNTRDLPAELGKCAAPLHVRTRLLNPYPSYTAVPFLVRALAASSAMFRWLNALNERATTKKDVGWSWVVCIVCLFFNFFVNGFSLTIGLLYSYLLDEFQESRAETGTFLIHLK